MNLLYIHWNASPEIVDIGAFAIRYYSLFFAGGILFSYLYLQKKFRKEEMSEEQYGKFALYVIVGTVLGARLGHCLFYEPDYYLAHPLEIILPFQGIPFTKNFQFTGYQGLASHGGSIGIFLGIFFFCRKYHFKLLWILDRLCLAIPVAAGMIRLGNLMNSEIIGKPTDVSWAFIFERVDMLPRHPTQIYEAVLYFALFFILRYIFNKVKDKKVNGIVFGWFLIILFLMRFFIEFLKAEQESFEKNLPLDMGQLLSIPFIIAGIVLVVSKRKMKQEF